MEGDGGPGIAWGEGLRGGPVGPRLDGLGLKGGACAGPEGSFLCRLFCEKKVPAFGNI